MPRPERAYRVRTEDGQEFQGTDLAALKRAHPTGTITHVLEADNNGDLTVPVAYTGKQPNERRGRAETEAEAAAAPAEVPAADAPAARGKKG